MFLDDASREVLIAARDAVHAGWKVTHHPLYGNFRPYHQPYRTLLLAFDLPLSARANPENTNNLHCSTAPDVTSIDLMEAALAIYRENRLLLASMVPKSFCEDCSNLDYELMRLPLEQSGWPVYPVEWLYGNSASNSPEHNTRR